MYAEKPLLFITFFSGCQFLSSFILVYDKTMLVVYTQDVQDRVNQWKLK